MLLAVKRTTHLQSVGRQGLLHLLDVVREPGVLLVGLVEHGAEPHLPQAHLEEEAMPDPGSLGRRAGGHLPGTSLLHVFRFLFCCLSLVSSLGFLGREETAVLQLLEHSVVEKMCVRSVCSRLVCGLDRARGAREM